MKLPFRMTERDWAILEYLGKYRFATVEDVRDKFWKGVENRHYYRRLKVLQARRLVEPLIGDFEQRLGYRLTRKGILWLKRYRGFEPMAGVKIRPTYRGTWGHELVLQDVAEIFKASPLVSAYQAEWVVRSELAKRHGIQKNRDERYKVPDGIFQLKTSNGTFRVALEVELSAKSIERYRKAFRQLSISRDFDLIFFVVKRVSHLGQLRKLLAEARENDFYVKIQAVTHGFYFVELSELLDKKLDALFQGEGDSFSLNSLARKS